MRHAWFRLAGMTVIAFGFAAALASAGPLPLVKVSPNRRFLVTADGRPFFWLGDTAWELFHRLNREDAERYLDGAREQRFTVIQAVALAEFDGLGARERVWRARRFGTTIPRSPTSAYFAHVDWIVAKANSPGPLRRLSSDVGRQVEQEVGPGSGDLHGRERRALWRVARTALQGRGARLDSRRRSAGRERRAARHHPRAGQRSSPRRRGPPPHDVPSDRRAMVRRVVPHRRLARLQHAPERPRR